jgi:hypothetical protein
MKTSIKFFIAFAFTLGISMFNLKAQNSENQPEKTTFSLEIDPATFVFNGYSAHLRIKPKNSEHLLVGAGIYAMDMPDPFVNINKENRNKGWQVRINTGAGLFGEYHFKQVNRGFFGGGQLSIQEFKIENDNTAGSEKFSNVLVMPYGGYTFQPFDFPLYFKAWGGLGYTSKISGENKLGDLEYDISPISMFATLHIGYTF